MVTAHPDFGNLFSILNSAAGPARVPFDGDVFRITEPKWMSQPYRLTGVGAVLSGGRWNVQNLMPAIYFSTTAATATAEADAKAIRAGWPTALLTAHTRVAFHLHLQAMLDLTDASTLATLHLTTAQLLTCSWDAEQRAGREALTQAVARATFETVGEGVIVPSAQIAGGVNIVVFATHVMAGSTITAHHPNTIPFVHGL